METEKVTETETELRHNLDRFGIYYMLVHCSFLHSIQSNAKSEIIKRTLKT